MMKSLRKVLLLCSILISLSAGCSPTPEQVSAIETQAAQRIFATLTASVPEATPTPPAPPTATPTPLPTLTPTPLPLAVVKTSNLNLRDGPGTNYPSQSFLARDTQLLLLGQYQSCAWVKVQTPAGKEGWVSGDETLIGLEVDCALIPHASFRPTSGSLLYDTRSAFGKGELNVLNGGKLDAVVVLTDSVGKPLTAVYIQANQNFTLTQIADNSYRFYYMRGQNWDGDLQQFMQIAEVKKLDESLAFVPSGGNPSVWNIDLQPDGSGSLSTSDVPIDQFPKTE